MVLVYACNSRAIPLSIEGNQDCLLPCDILAAVLPTGGWREHETVPLKSNVVR